MFVKAIKRRALAPFLASELLKKNTRLRTGSRGNPSGFAVTSARPVKRAALGPPSLFPDYPGLSCSAGFSARTCSSATAVAVAEWCSLFRKELLHSFTALTRRR